MDIKKYLIFNIKDVHKTCNSRTAAHAFCLCCLLQLFGKSISVFAQCIHFNWQLSCQKKHGTTTKEKINFHSEVSKFIFKGYLYHLIVEVPMYLCFLFPFQTCRMFEMAGALQSPLRIINILVVCLLLADYSKGNLHTNTITLGHNNTFAKYQVDLQNIKQQQ